MGIRFLTSTSDNVAVAINGRIIHGCTSGVACNCGAIVVAVGLVVACVEGSPLIVNE